MKPGDDVPRVPPVDWSQVPAELWTLPVAVPEQLALDFSDAED